MFEKEIKEGRIARSMYLDRGKEKEMERKEEKGNNILKKMRFVKGKKYHPWFSIHILSRKCFERKESTAQPTLNHQKNYN